MGSSNYAKWIHSVTFGSPYLYDEWADGRLEPYDGPFPAYEGVFNTWDDWKLIPLSRPIVALPKIGIYDVETGQTDGGIDLSDIAWTSCPCSGSMEFAIMNPDIPDRYNTNWVKNRTQIMAFLHNRRRFMKLDDNPIGYYEGRFQVSFSTIDGYSTVKIDYVLDVNNGGGIK